MRNKFELEWVYSRNSFLFLHENNANQVLLIVCYRNYLDDRLQLSAEYTVYSIVEQHNNQPLLFYLFLLSVNFCFRINYTSCSFNKLIKILRFFHSRELHAAHWLFYFAIFVFMHYGCCFFLYFIMCFVRLWKVILSHFQRDCGAIF